MHLNEPLNTLQRLCEELEYSELLDTAAVTLDPFERMVRWKIHHLLVTFLKIRRDSANQLTATNFSFRDLVFSQIFKTASRPF